MGNTDCLPPAHAGGPGPTHLSATPTSPARAGRAWGSLVRPEAVKPEPHATVDPPSESRNPAAPFSRLHIYKEGRRWREGENEDSETDELES